MKKVIITVAIVVGVIVVLFILLVGLGLLQGSKMLPSVDAFIDDYYKHYNTQDYEYIYNSLLEKKYVDAIKSYDNFGKFMGRAYNVLGKVISKERGGWQVNTATDGVYFMVEYKTVRENGNAVESFVLVRNKASWLMLKNHIASDALMQAMLE